MSLLAIVVAVLPCSLASEYAAGFWSCAGSGDPLCGVAYDLDGDGQIDLADYAAFVAAFGGPTVPAPDVTRRVVGSPSRYGNPFFWTSQRYDATLRLYHFLYRSYSPTLGRFLQRDMLGVLAALPEISLSSDGFGPFVGPPMVGATGEYGDGLNLFQYVASNPINLTDPSGLYFDEIDEIIGSLIGDRLAGVTALFAHVMKGINIAQHIALASVAFLPGGDVVLLGAKIASQGWDKVGWGDIAAAGLSVGGGAIVGKVLYKFYKGVKKYKSSASKIIRNNADEGLPLSKVVGGGVCFAAGTLAAMADGTFVPIEEIERDDQVLCDYNPAECDGAEVCKVVAVFERTAERVVDLTIEVDGDLVSITATPEHFVYVPETDAYVPLAKLKVGTALQGPAGRESVVADVGQGYGPARVYNFASSGAHNYYVSNRPGAGLVLVHNNPCAAGFNSFGALKNALGPAGPGKVWHHIVEKNKVGQFAAETIHNVDNVVPISTGIHNKISGYYNSIRDFTKGKRVREYLRGKSFEEQYRFGLDVIQKLGGS